jgi:hypothetical protein
MFSLRYIYKFCNFANVLDNPAPTISITEIFLPARRYAEAIKAGNVSIKVSDGDWRYDEQVSHRRPSASLTES